MSSSRAKGIEDFGANLFFELCEVFPGLLGGSLKSLYHDIAVSAAELEAKIHLSTIHYRFTDEQQSILGEISLANMKNATWLDVNTRKSVSPNNKMLPPDGEGYVGDSLLQIEPGLLRINQNQKEIVLRPPKYVMKLYGPAPKRVKIEK